MLDSQFQYILRPGLDRGRIPSTDFGSEIALKARDCLKTFPGYAVTALESLPALSRKLGLGGVCVKDEHTRFGLNAFKALGGSYAMARLLCRRRGLDADRADFHVLKDGSADSAEFVTATDGNHGRGVAWAARQLGCPAHVYMPRGTARERLDNTLALCADARILDVEYDDAVRYAAQMARNNGWTLVQDTAWEGYTEVPLDVMRGYTVLGAEILEQHPGFFPTHIFLQAGVGSMAAAVAAFFCDAAPTERPRIVLVEPTNADCCFQTALHPDGKLHSARGPLDSMMAGLNCGELNPLAWDVLSGCADACLACGDEIAAVGMNALAHPLQGDPAIVSGESGAATTGALIRIMTDDSLIAFRKALRLDGRSRVLLISTEGATDRENYARVTGIRL